MATVLTYSKFPTGISSWENQCSDRWLCRNDAESEELGSPDTPIIKYSYPFGAVETSTKYKIKYNALTRAGLDRDRSQRLLVCSIFKSMAVIASTINQADRPEQMPSQSHLRQTMFVNERYLSSARQATCTSSEASSRYILGW